MRKPALSLAAVAKRRLQTLDVAADLEREGFSGLYCPSFGDPVALCEALALRTREIPFGTSIANIYTRHPQDFALTAAFIHEISGGRFRFGVGVSHAAVNERMGLSTGKPLADMRRFASQWRDCEAQVGTLPPLLLATLRRRMVELAAEIADGAVWANAALSHMRTSLAALPPTLGSDFFLGNMIPTCVSEDRPAAAAVMRKALRMYVRFPNYRRYWSEAGYGEEMAAIEAALNAGQRDRLETLMHDRWLRDVTLFGSAAEVREGTERWYEAGVREPILVPSSTSGGQMQALREIVDVFR